MLWYLNRHVSAYEWGALADICTPAHTYDLDGTYAFIAAGNAGVINEQLTKAAWGTWRQVA